MYILCEPTVTYNYGQSKIPQYHDKTFKELFSNKIVPSIYPIVLYIGKN